MKPDAGISPRILPRLPNMLRHTHKVRYTYHVTGTSRVVTNKQYVEPSLCPKFHLNSAFFPPFFSTMDKPLPPPLRIQVISSKPVKPSSAIPKLDAFLDDYQARHGPGDNATIRVQMQRLLESLKAEHVQAKKSRS